VDVGDAVDVSEVHVSSIFDTEDVRETPRTELTPRNIFTLRDVYFVIPRTMVSFEVAYIGHK
jgi:hypothetical protein